MVIEMSNETKQLELKFEGNIRRYNGKNKTPEDGYFDFENKESFYERHNSGDVFITTVEVNDKIYDIWLFGRKINFLIIISLSGHVKDEFAFAWENEKDMFICGKFFHAHMARCIIITDEAILLHEIAEVIVTEEDLLNKEWQGQYLP